MEQSVQTFEEALDYLLNIPKFTGKNDKRDTDAFLRQLNNPQQKMKIIHIAGTNGKGSVCAYLCSLLMEMGYCVGTFLSPHLVELRERIRINEEAVSNEELLKAFQRIQRELNFGEKQTREGYHPSYFEYLFFMAMVIFKERKPDYIILETGLGGRLDATNSVEEPLISVITRIGMDHMEYLGNTITSIAGEKAGIIKTKVPVVFDANVVEAAEVIEQKAKECGCQIFPVSKKDYNLLNFMNKNIDFSYHSRYYDYISLRLSTTALYQMENASLALRAAEVLFSSKQLTVEVMQEGIRRTHWEGRMEEVLEEVYVDGAHNEDGIRAFIDSVRQDGCEGSRYLIFGVVKDKSYETMIKLLVQSGLFVQMTAAHIANTRSLSADALRQTFRQCTEAEIEIFQEVFEAYRHVAEKKRPEDKIYIVGSLYLAGEFKEKLNGVHKTDEGA